MSRVAIIGGCIQKPVFECDHCKYGKFDEFDQTTSCTCPDEQLCDYIMVLVSVEGVPIPTKPKNTPYTIRIWQGQEILNMFSKENYDRVVYSDPEAEFMLESTDDPADMEHLYVDICKKYCLSEINFSLLANKQNFKARCPPRNYLLDFESRLTTLISSTERKTEQEAPHVSRRKKGHSHVVKKKK